MSSPRRYCQQIDDLAMDSPPASQLTNLWLCQFEDLIQEDAETVGRYTDDII